MKYLRFIHSFLPTAFLLALAFSKNVFSQNLVPNSSFEDTLDCNTKYYIDVAPPWFNPNLASSDYFTTNWCGIDIYNNSKGFQMPRTGVAFAGIYGFGTWADCTREYIEAPLLSPLLAGKKYCVSFYVSLANSSMYEIDRIGAYFSNDSVTDWLSGCELPYKPQVGNPAGNIIADTLNWVLVSGDFFANGGEKFITIGNFYGNDSTNVDSTNGGIFNVAYYYIDDVSVTLCDTAAGHSEYASDNAIKLFPDINGNYILQCGGTPIKSVHVYNALGKLVLHISENSLKQNTSTVIDIRQHPEGIYFIMIQTDNSIIAKKILITD